MGELFFLKVKKCWAPVTAYVSADMCQGLVGVLELFYMTLAAYFVAHFFIVNYGAQHWLASLMKRHHWWVMLNCVGAVMLYNVGQLWVYVAVLAYQLAVLLAWHTNAFDRAARYG